jgi:hypothetical protein
MYESCFVMHVSDTYSTCQCLRCSKKTANPGCMMIPVRGATMIHVDQKAEGKLSQNESPSPRELVLMVVRAFVWRKFGIETWKHPYQIVVFAGYWLHVDIMPTTDGVISMRWLIVSFPSMHKVYDDQRCRGAGRRSHGVTMIVSYCLSRGTNPGLTV